MRPSFERERLPRSTKNNNRCPQFEFGGKDDKAVCRQNCFPILTNNPYNFGEGDERAEYRSKLAPLRAAPHEGMPRRRAS